MEIVVQLRRGVEISSFTTFPLPLFTSLRYFVVLVSPFFRFTRFSVFPPLSCEFFLLSFRWFLGGLCGGSLIVHLCSAAFVW